MTPERWQQVNDLLQSALECEPDQRATFLDEACANDPSLRRQLEDLITADERAANFLETPAIEAGHLLFSDNQAGALEGRRIGAYKVLHEIGHGGMGAVYLAIRADDRFHKQVAIKFVKRGMDTDAILSRFHKEQEILANLDHPNIAKLLDSGTTDDGLSYFIMDYVEGRPIDEYCDIHKLPTIERLKLFRRVCSAVDYAHRHHVVHRDLKPSNILVTSEGVPKLLDFGIAKLLNPDRISGSISTGAAPLPMTPEYASPEQVCSEAITPASDIYSLGVLLYELLTGHRPYGFQSRQPQEIERVLREEQPDRPSVAIGRVDEVLSTDGVKHRTLTPEAVSETRDGQPDTLRRRLTGDLDNIVLMALRKEPSRRYASVEQFSEDIRRHMAGLPVIARKDTVWYRSAKFIKRKKSGVIAAVTLALLLLLNVELYLFIVRSKAIDSVAILPFVNASVDSNTEYLSDGITDHLIHSLSQLPNLKVMSRNSVLRYKGRRAIDAQAVGRDLGVRAVLEGRIVSHGEEFSLSLALVDTQDKSHLWSGQYNRKLSDIFAVEEGISQEISEKLGVRLIGEARKRLTKRYTENTEAYQDYIKGRYYWYKRTGEGVKKSIEYFEKAIEKDPNYTLAYAGLAEAYTEPAFLGVVALSPREAMAKAKTAAQKALELDDTSAEAHSALANIRLNYDWDWSSAERENRRAIALNPNHPNAHHSYSHCLMAVGRIAESLTESKEALRLDPLDLIINVHLGWHYLYARQYDQAIEQLRKTLELDSNIAQAHHFLGEAYAQTARYPEAIAEFHKASLLNNTPRPLAFLGHCYALSGKRKEAQKVLDELKELSQRTYVSPYFIAIIYVGLGEKDQAFLWLEKAYEEHSELLVYLKVEPDLDSLRPDPRFADLLRRIGLLP